MSVCKPILLEKFAPQKIVYTGIQSSALQYAAFIHMLVSPSDFNARPIGRALWKDFGKTYLSFLDFTLNYTHTSGIIVPEAYKF